MRRIIQTTFQGLTKNPKFTPEFFNFLFLVTLFQVTVFAHYYQNSFRTSFNWETYEVQDQTLQVGQTQEAVIKGIHPFSHIYLKISGNEVQAKLHKARDSLNTFSPMHVKNIVYPKILELSLKSLPKIQLNIINILKSKPNNILEPLLFSISNQDPVFEFFPLLPRTSFSFLAKDKYETPTQDPDPFNSAPFSASTFEVQKDQVEQSLESFLEEQEMKGLQSISSTRQAEIEFKDNSSKKVFEEVSTSKNESVNNLPSSDVSENASGKKSKPEFKAFHQYKIDSKSRLLNFWMQCTAPSENVLEEEIPYRNALIKLLLSDKYKSLVNETEWLSEPEDDEEIKLILSKRREKAFYDYLRSINWEETEFGTLFKCPQISGKEDFHQANEEAFLYAYDLIRRCAPGFCEDEDLCVD